MSDLDNNGKDLKSTKWKVAGQVIVAFLTVYATVLVTWMSDKSASEEELKKTITRQELMLNELNKIVIPAIKRRFEDMALDYKELMQDEAAARERIAKLEGILEAVLRKVKRNEITVVTDRINVKEKPKGLLERLLDKTDKPEKLKTKSIKIPKLQMQQQRLMPSLDSPITNENK